MTLEYSVTQKRTPAGFVWFVNRGSSPVERFKTEEAAVKSARRKNRLCVACDGRLPNHEDHCPLKNFVRDTSFGSEYDDSDGDDS